MSDPSEAAPAPAAAAPVATARRGPVRPEGATGSFAPIQREGSSHHSYTRICAAAIETTRLPMCVSDPRQPDNPLVFVNAAFRDLTGYTEEELLGSNCRFLQGPDTDHDAVTEIHNAIMDKRDLAIEILNYRKDGSSFWNALFISPVYDDEGQLLYFFGSQLDVSRRRDAEDALRQSQKMEALGQLTGGIAHDFNNLLQVMSGYLELIDLAASGPAVDAERLKRNVARAREAADRAATLTRQLLAFSRKQKLEGRVVNLNGLVNEMGDIAERTLGGDIEFIRALAPQLWNCRIDPTQAELAMLNVLINARDALAGCQRRRVVIETANVTVLEEDAFAYESLPPGRYASIAVTDTGQGMTPEILARVMEPFFTTKEEGKGTGLGLSMVHGFAKQSGGTVRLYSEPGQGTTVRLYFPIDDSMESVAPRQRTRNSSRRGSESVLIVEDRTDVADLARIFLQDQGYRTYVAHDATAALELIDRGTSLDLLFSDMIMPGSMNGAVLAREALRRRPRLKVLLTTGYSELSRATPDTGGPDFEVLPKPYSRKDLVRRVRTVLDAATAVS